MAVKYIPDGVHTITPYLTVSDTAAVLDFILRGLDNVTRIHEMKGTDGKIWHADLKIGDSHLMLGQAGKPEDAMQSMLYLYVPDCDVAFRKALVAGGTVHSELQTQFYGDRHGCVKDPCGNQWWFATHVEDVSPGPSRYRIGCRVGGIEPVLTLSTACGARHRRQRHYGLQGSPWADITHRALFIGPASRSRRSSTGVAVPRRPDR